MGIKNFFRKISPNNVSKAFIKGGDIANKYFKKAEDISNDIQKKAPNFIDVALRKTQNSMGKLAPIVDKIGQASGMISPLLTAIPGIGVPLAGATASFSQSAPKIAKGLKTISNTSSDLRHVAKGNYSIEAPKPPQQEDDSEMFGNLFV